ncbi:MAG TPA: hypothetical protein VFE59_03980 [Trebonia sp.]|nr:hypothetical protein [Trebonia sp.]
MEVAASPAGDWLRLNRAWWDERAPVHAASGFYDGANPGAAGARAGDGEDGLRSAVCGGLRSS